MRIPRHFATVLTACLLAAVMELAGCRALKSDAGLLDPTAQWKAPPSGQTPINPILAAATYADPADEILPNSTPPTREDLLALEKDYVMGPTDVLDIGILDLFQEGVETVLRREVSETGFIRLPRVDEPVKAAGLTKDQLRDRIADIYSPEILLDPTISITILLRRQNTFTILGAVQRPSQYSIIRPDLRLLEAIGLAADIVQPSIRYIYVIRQAPPEREAVPTAVPPTLPPPTPETAIAPPTERSKEVEEAERERALREWEKVLEGLPPEKQPPEEPFKPDFIPYMTETAGGSGAGPAAASTEPAAPNKPYKWVYESKEKKWVRVPVEPAPATEPSVEAVAPTRPVEEIATQPTPPTTQEAFVAETLPVPPEPVAERPVPTPPAPRPEPQTQPEIVVRELEEEDPFGWKATARKGRPRVIAINLKKLRAGDDRMNIVIRDKDIIYVPPLEIGEFYIAGEVLRPGVYQLTGRKVTVKQALAAAGNLAPLAWPKNAVLVRRIGNNQEQIVPLDIEAIMRTEEPDLFLKPDDLIAVGSHASTPFLAVLRNAFRMTYGFGAIYDRNFGEPVLPGMSSRRFKRW